MKLIDVSGDVGGLIEVIYSIANIISSLIVGILYEESLVNSLFIFDLDKKVISLKEKKSKRSINFVDEDLLDLKNSQNSTIPRKSAIIKEESILENILI